MRHHTSISHFGRTPDGRTVSVIALDNGTISCKILTYQNHISPSLPFRVVGVGNK